MNTQIEEKLSNILEQGRGTDRDRVFADSLLNGKYGLHQRGYLTENQERAALSMIDRIDNPPPVEHVAHLGKVYDFLMKARKHLRYPKLMLSMGDHTLKVYMSGNKSKYPDTVNLVTGDGTWLGRVLEDGEWQHRRGDSELRQQAAELLYSLAKDPAKAAAESGHLSGNCCFCNRPLKDHRSTEVGYGPVCAKRWGVHWG